MGTPWLWIGFSLFVLGLLALDMGLLHRSDKTITVREALLLSLGYIVLALIFAMGLFVFVGSSEGYQFLTGYLIEKSLSVDNIFVFVLIFMHFQVPPQYQYRVLLYGVLGALVLRATLILVGAAMIEAFEWVIYLFGVFLIFTGIRMLVAVGQEPDLEKNRIALFIRRYSRVTEDFVGHRFFVRRDGLLYLTPLFIVLVVVELTDLVFALDSIPAIFAITTDPFIVYTSNVFAILGLRALYFALVGIIHRFRYLKYGLSLVLVVVGTKMILNAWFGRKLIPTEVALLITAVLIVGSIMVSLLKTRGIAPEQAPVDVRAWWVPGSPPKKRPKTKKSTAP